MLSKEYINIEHRNRVIKAVQAMTQTEEADFGFEEIAWDEQNPVLMLKGRGDVPDFKVTFGLNECNIFVIRVTPEGNPALAKNIETSFSDNDLLARAIILGCCMIMLNLGINPSQHTAWSLESWLTLMRKT
jgi:hypothetical protein